MKNRMLLILSLLLFFSVLVSCDKGSDIILIKSELISDDEYLIVCKGFPKEDLENEMQRELTAKDASMMNAQMFAKEKLDGVDVSRGEIRSFTYNGSYGIIEYVLREKNIKDKVR